MAAPPIVVGYDGSESGDAALRWAVDEGARCGAPVLLVLAFEWWVSADFAGLGPAVWSDSGTWEDAEKFVATAAATVRERHPDVAVTGMVADGPADDVLVDQSRRASLMVVGGRGSGSRGSGGVMSLLAGSTSVAVAAHAHCPVVVVPGQEPPAGAPVVVAFEGSDIDLPAVEFGFAQAAARDTSVDVVRGWTPPASKRRPRDVHLEEQIGAEKAKLNEAVATWRHKHPQVSTDVHVVTGLPVPALVEASRSAQLLVVGGRGEVGFRGLLMGAQLLHRSFCPVAIVR